MVRWIVGLLLATALGCAISCEGSLGRPEHCQATETAPVRGWELAEFQIKKMHGDRWYSAALEVMTPDGFEVGLTMFPLTGFLGDPVNEGEKPGTAAVRGFVEMLRIAGATDPDGSFLGENERRLRGVEVEAEVITQLLRSGWEPLQVWEPSDGDIDSTYWFRRPALQGIQGSVNPSAIDEAGAAAAR